MSLKTERDLSPSHRAQVSKAKLAVQSNNADYAISLYQAVLKDEPLYLEGRRKLRDIEIKKFQALSSFNKQMLNVKLSAAVMKLSSLGKKSPGEQLAAAEEVLALDPFQAKANSVIAEAGTALGYPAIKVFAFEVLSVGKPNDKPVLNSLAHAYMENKEPAKAVEAYQRILNFDSKDGEALSGLKNALSADASKSGGWELADKAPDANTPAVQGEPKAGWRNALKSKEESEQLEAEAKNIKSLDAIDAQIQVNFKRHEEDPQNPAYSKAIAKLYVDKNDYASAIPWYQHAFEVGGRIDSALEKTMGDLMLKKVEQELQQLKSGLNEQTDPDQQAAYQAAIEEKAKEINEVRLFQAEARVRAQPNDGEFRFDLGDALFKMGQYKRATEELQLSLKQPSVRYQALNKMGLSFMHRGMLDFAVKQLVLAESEIPGMDELKKEIVYNLGLAYEASKKPDKALDQWKKIYEYDMSYRDVAARVEASYGEQN